MGVVVATTHGKIEGVQAEGHQFFRGIPYAAPPVGDARFAAPRPPEPWAGIRDCSEFGPSAPQPPSPLPGMESGPQGEDCLSLNVYTPAAAGATPAAAGATPAAAGATPATAAASRPVMVWIHGGGFTGGSGSQALYQGASLTCRGQIVLVTVNYRLGILGYLHLADHADRLEGATSNVGQRDQIAALKWVRDNIEAFGGDPNRVTIFGESAGGMAVSTLLAMPGARGLFHGAIAQSGATHATHSRDSATRVVDAVLGELEISSEKIERLREISTDEILRAQLRVSAQLAGDVFLSYAPTIDADTLPQAPLDLIRAGESQDIPLMVGANQDEWKLFSVMNPKHFELDDASLTKAVASRLRNLEGADPQRIIEIYRACRPQAPAWDILDAIETDRVFRVPAIRLAEARSAHQASTYKYSFNWKSPARRGKLGSCHALELPFVFNTFDAPTMDRFAGTGPEADALCQAMMDSWVAFARGGDPNCDALPAWSPYGEEKRSTMILDRTRELRDAPADRERAAWDGLL